MLVIDMYARVIETRNITANSITRFGYCYRPGDYLLRIKKGEEHNYLKPMKFQIRNINHRGHGEPQRCVTLAAGRQVCAHCGLKRT